MQIPEMGDFTIIKCEFGKYIASSTACMTL